MKKRILSILLLCCMVLTLLPTAAFAADTGKAIQLGTDALSKNVNTASAPTVYFGQDHENNPGAWRVIDYDGNSAAGIAGNMTLLAANNMGVVKVRCEQRLCGQRVERGNRRACSKADDRRKCCRKETDA